jgi:hypothetical protein
MLLDTANVPTKCHVPICEVHMCMAHTLELERSGLYNRRDQSLQVTIIWFHTIIGDLVQEQLK